MASNVREFDYTENDVGYVRKLVYDVVMYTLRKYKIRAGTESPPTNLEVNVYNRDNFVEIVGLSALRISLILRDKWKHMFISRHRSAGFHRTNIHRFLKQLIILSPLSWNDTQQSAIEAALALCNEILLFFHDAGINFDAGVVMDATSIYILSVIPPNQSIPETIERLIGKIDNVSEYDEWITEFLHNFAISYGLKDVSDYFFEYVKVKWQDDSEKDGSSEPVTLEELRDYLGFLPDDLFATIAYEDDYPESLKSAWISPSYQESSDSQKLRTISEACAVEEEPGARQPTRTEKDSAETAQAEDSSKTSSEPSLEEALEEMSLGATISEDCAVEEEPGARKTSRTEKDSAETAQAEDSSKTSSEPGLEKALEEMSLVAGVSQECHGAIPKSKKSKKKKKSK